MDKKMQIRIPEDIYKEFKELAKENAQIPSLLVRNWIEKYVKENRKKS